MKKDDDIARGNQSLHGVARDSDQVGIFGKSAFHMGGAIGHVVDISAFLLWTVWLLTPPLSAIVLTVSE